MLTYLITGGTGTLGKALIKHLNKDNILRIYSRDEYKQYELKDTPNCRFLMGDVRDKARLDYAMNGVDIVIHAAALKNIEKSEYDPFEFIKTNVYGTQNVIDCALRHKPRQVLLVSTDKAVNPENLYGATKLCAERLIQAANNYKGKIDTQFKFVRYGNVWGSRASVLEQWEKQNPFEVRIPDATRFHLSIDDAVETVMNALNSNQVKNIPTIRAYELINLAVAYSHLTGKRYEITEPLPGEKTHEFLDSDYSSYNAEKLRDEELQNLVSDYLNSKGHLSSSSMDTLI